MKNAVEFKFSFKDSSENEYILGCTLVDEFIDATVIAEHFTQFLKQIGMLNENESVVLDCVQG